jgi:hypothetical protein
LKAEKVEKSMMRKAAKQQAAAQRRERRASLQAERGLQKQQRRERRASLQTERGLQRQQRRAEKLRRKSGEPAPAQVSAVPNCSDPGQELGGRGAGSGEADPPGAAAPEEGVRAGVQSEAEREAKETRELRAFDAGTDHDSGARAEAARKGGGRGRQRKRRDEQQQHRARTTRRRVSAGSVRARARRRDEAAAAPRRAREPPFDVLAPEGPSFFLLFALFLFFAHYFFVPRQSAIRPRTKS